MIKKIVMIVCLLSAAVVAGAQDPVTVIKEGVTKVIKAVDLEIQRIQTQTIWLEEAQKTVENVMSQLDLDDIKSWVQAQKDLYNDYFNELWQVKTVIADYHRIEEIIQRQEQILSVYSQAWGRLKQDPHFSADELAHMSAVYTGILNESGKNLDQLFLVINSFSVQMSDEDRMAIIDKAGAGMDKTFTDLSLYNNQNTLLSLQRQQEANNIEILKSLYGL